MADRKRMVLVLWDVDHTLIENAGVSKANYRLAFRLLTGRQPEVEPRTDGRTDFAIMDELLRANGASPEGYSLDVQWRALSEAGERNRSDLAARGHVIPGAATCLARLQTEPDVVQSVLTGNIEANARVKLSTFGLDGWLDFAVGAFGSEDRVRAKLVPVAQRKAAARNGFDPAADVTVLIGDTPLDVHAGLDGGARVVAVATGSAGVGELEAAGADIVLADLKDAHQLWAAIEKLRDVGPVAPRDQAMSGGL